MGTLLAVLLLALASTDAAGQVRVRADGTAVRLRPDATSAVVATLPAGTTLELQSREGDWYAVLLPADERGLRRYGFLPAASLDLTSDPPPGNRDVLAGVESNAAAGSLPAVRRLFVLDTNLRAVAAVSLDSGQVRMASLRPGRPLTTANQDDTDRDSPAELLLSPNGSRLVAIDYGRGKESAHGWNPSRRSSLVVFDAASLDTVGSTEGVWGGPPLYHFAAGGSRLAVAGPGYRSGNRKATRPPELLTIDLGTASVLARFDLTGTISADITARDWHRYAAFSADGAYLYVLERGKPSRDRRKHVNGRIVVISTFTGKALTTLPAGSNPHELVVDTNGGKVLVLSDVPPYGEAGEASAELRIIEGDALAATVPVAPDPQVLRISPDGAFYHVFSARALTTVDAIAGRGVGLTRVDRAGPPLGVGVIPWLLDGDVGEVNEAAVAPDGRRAYVLHSESSQLSILDLEARQRIATVNTGRRSKKVVNVLLAGLQTSLSRSAAEARARAAGQQFYFYQVYAVAPPETDLAVRPDGKFVYVLNTQTEDVSVFDAEAARLVKYVKAAGTNLELLPNSDYLTVSGAEGLTFIDTRTQTEAKDLERLGRHHALTMSPGRDRLVALSNGLVASLNPQTGRVAASYTEFLGPTQVLFDTPASSSTGLPAAAAAAPSGEPPGGGAPSPAPATPLVISRWSVRHVHSTGASCGGWLYVSEGRLGFRAVDHPAHAVEVPYGQVREVKGNRMFTGGNRNGSFHVALRDGRNYNFLLEGFTADRLVPLLQDMLDKAAKTPQ